MKKSEIEYGWELYNDWANHVNTTGADLKYERLATQVKQNLSNPLLTYLGILDVYSIVRASHNRFDTVLKILKLIGVEVTND